MDTGVKETSAAPRRGRSTAARLPIMGAVFVAFLVIGIALPVLPLHVHQGLGLGTFVVGLVAGSQFGAAILSRVWAGRDADASGPKHAVIVGLSIAAAAGLLYLLSLDFGGAKVALLCVLVEAAGLALIWLAPVLALALIGAALTGFGYSLVYPGLGVEAVRLVPAQSRGLAMGAYTAFLDVALGFGTPALGFLAEHAGLGAVFGASMGAALGAGAIAAALLFKPHASRTSAALACS